MRANPNLPTISIMTYIFERINRIYNPLIFREKDPINRARIKMLSYVLTFYPLFTGILIVAYLISGETLHLIRVCFVFGGTLSLLAIAYFTHAWKLVSHVVLWICALVIWSNLLIYIQGIDIETLQCIWLGCMLSFYMHGSKWGMFYSAIYILPVVFFTAIGTSNYLNIGVAPVEQSSLSYLYVICYNFLLIIFLQHYFFKEFNRNFMGLTHTKNELRGLNERLKLSLNDVEQLSNARMEFLSTMSHELRTPLNGVIGMTNVLLQNPRADQEENLDLLKFSTENLLSLINDVLDFNKFDSNKVELESTFFNLSGLIDNNFATIRQKAEKKSLHLSLEIDEKLVGIRVNSDPTRLTQVLSNLLNNAINFTEKGTVSLYANLLDLSENQVKVRFIIQDTGIGIDPDRQESIFEPYVQASSNTNRHYGGTGLGLPIVKKILNMFNSQIALESTLHIGTKISFELDFNYEHCTVIAATDDLKEMTNLGHLKILVAEDNVVNQLVIKKTLEKWNIVPEIADNGAIALEKLGQKHFDLILMDLFMPIMDGYEATANIRKLKDPIKVDIPIIALTAQFDEKVAQKVLSSTMNDYLSKPFNPDHLFEKLKFIADKKIKRQASNKALEFQNQK